MNFKVFKVLISWTRFGGVEYSYSFFSFILTFYPVGNHVTYTLEQEQKGESKRKKNMSAVENMSETSYATEGLSVRAFLLQDNQ